MATLTTAEAVPIRKGLRSGALGLAADTVIGVASTAPAYSLAATLGFVVAAVGLQTPSVVVLAFIPMLFTAIGYSELNKADPDCGTTFTWSARAFGPITGWLGGWGIIAADVLVMASLAQIAGQYTFLLFNNQSIGANATSGWVLLVGVIFIVLMTAICYRGIELSARSQQILLSIEVTMLVLLSVVALVRIGTGHAPAGHLVPHLSWLNPLNVSSFNVFVTGLLLMLFIYWGWDTAVTVNEESRDSRRIPGLAGILSTVLLLVIYALVTLSVQAFAGIGTKGIGLGNTANQGDVLSVLGHAVFGSSGFGTVLTRLLILMVLSSAAASTQTTILPNARTTLSMAVHKAIPDSFGRVHKRFQTPSVSTVAMGVASIACYLAMNWAAHGFVIADSVSALGIMIAFYYGLTGFACAWTYRHTLTESARNLFMRGILPVLGGLILFFALFWSIWHDWYVASSYTFWTLPFSPHWQIGGVFLIGIGTAVLGVVLMLVMRVRRPAYFRGRLVEAPVTGEAPAAAADAAVPEPRPGTGPRTHEPY